MNTTCRVLLAALVLTVTPVHVAASAEQHWHFDVYLDDKKIGHHHFERRKAGQFTMLRSEARFNVRFLFINAYTYEHTNFEQWNGDCLQRINAVTNDNGERHVVAGQRADDRFIVKTRDEHQSLQSCVRSFAYWDLAALKQADRLLNAQTGEYLAAQLTPLGTETLQLHERQVRAERYRLVGEDLAIDLWYSLDAQWLALETDAEGGRRLRYRIRSN